MSPTNLSPSDQREPTSFSGRQVVGHFFEVSPDMMCVVDFSGVLQHVNPAFRRALGYTEEELLLRSLYDFVHPDDMAASLVEMEKLSTTGQQTLNFDSRFRCHDGTWLHLSWVAAPVMEHGLVYATARDLTEIRRAESKIRSLNESLRFSEGEEAENDSLKIDDDARDSRFRYMIEQVVDFAIFTLDPSGMITSWNIGAQRVKGYVASEIVGQHFSRFYTAEDRMVGKPDILLSRARVRGHFLDEGWRVRKDGTRFWAQVILTTIIDSSGKLIGYSKVTHDLTERRRAELSLQESEARFRSAMENSPIGMALVSVEGRFLNVNRAIVRILGYESDELQALDVKAITHPADIDRDLGLLNSALKGDIETYEMEKRYFHRDGHIVWALLSVSLVRDASGRPLYFISQIQDITEQRRTVDEMRLAAERVQLATQVGKIGVWEMDVATERTTWDAQMYQIYGISPESADEGVAKGRQSIHPDDLSKVYEAFHNVLKGRGTQDGIEYRIFHGSGDGIRTIRSKATAILDEAGMPQRIIGICRDVTDERRREEDLSRALAQEKELTRKAQAGEHAKGEFLSVMSHEIRTPMNGILGFAELLARSPHSTEENRDHAYTILESGGILLRILDDILDFSSLEAGRIKLSEEKFSIRRLLKELSVLLTPTAKVAGVGLLVELADDVPEVLIGDPARVRQIILNLGFNAFKFTAEGSVILGARLAERGARADKYEVEFFVRDTGPGIEEDQKKAIFEPFVQADSSRSRRHGGVGLGLAISRGLAELMDGSLAVESVRGEGAEFILTVPLAKALADVSLREVPLVETSSDQPLAQRHPLKVLVVEDDRINLKLVLAMIRKFGYEPLSARDGREAVEVYEREHPDCIFMDLQMPGMDGIEATEKIREIERSESAVPTFIAALTANTVRIDKDRCYKAGMNDYLNKPVNRAHLASTLESASQYCIRKLDEQ